MPPRKKSGKPKKSVRKKPAAKKAAKKAVKKAAKKAVKKAAKKSALPKKAALSKVKKTAKKAAKPKGPSFVPADDAETVITGTVCRLIGTRWFCLKPDGDGHLVVCDGPFATKEDCEQNAVCG